MNRQPSFTIFTALIFLPLLQGCSGPQAPSKKPAAWSVNSVDFGQGQLHLGIRFRWVAEADAAGAVIRTPDGGEAFVRVFACDKSVAEMQKIVRERLRSRLIGSKIVKRKKQYHWRWRADEKSDKVMGTLVALHGPLLITITSSSLTQADLSGIARRTRLGLPVPTIPSCFPLCGVDGSTCVPQSGDEGS